MGSEAGCQFVKDVLDDYEKREFIYPEARMVRELSHHLSMLG